MLKRTSLFIVIFFVLLATNIQAALPNVTTDGKPFPTLSPMIKKVQPAVVNISTFSNHQQRNNPLLNDPFFRHFFNLPPSRGYEQPPTKRQQSAGSGVVVKADQGIVMTNHHVIKGADEVQVSLSDGRTFKADILGEDPELDIAILQIDAEDLVELKISNSNALEIGDFVVAVGNPFGLGQTVTTGIVSALGRSGLGIEGYENFIQTDASINPGNSGGALVNLAGELVGINTAIIAPSGGNVGIGFAIPSNMAKASMEQIIKHGEVKRGQLGIGIQDISEDLRNAFDLPNGQEGVLITNVMEDSPAEKARLKAGDIIIAVDDQKTTSTGQLRSQIAMKSIGEKVSLLVIRDGKEKRVKVKVGSPTNTSDYSGEIHKLLQGIEFENVSNDEGVRVVKLAPNSIAAYSGLRVGDVVVAANKLRVTDLNSFEAALNRSDSAILLQVNRRGGSLFIVIK